MTASSWTGPDAWPRTMKRGYFKDRTFESMAEYNRALRDLRTRVNGHHERQRQPVTPAAPSVESVIGAYETLQAAGIGRAKAVRVIEDLLPRLQREATAH
jgi:hypothetical protein